MTEEPMNFRYYPRQIDIKTGIFDVVDGEGSGSGEAVISNISSFEALKCAECLNQGLDAWEWKTRTPRNEAMAILD